jgi:flagellar biosynthesis protein FlhB
MKKRMMAAVPKASVIITNPTHFSVALAYDRDMSAPVCVAKGVDNIALKIREIAKEHEIPIVENVPLARALYATVEIDEEIRSSTIMRLPKSSAMSWVLSAGFRDGPDEQERIRLEKRVSHQIAA